MTKNLLVDWLNKTGVTNFLTDVQNLANKTSATNVNTVNTPNTPTKPEFKTHNTNMKTAVAPAAPTPTVSTVSQPGTITGNGPAFVNGQLRTPANNEVLAAARGQDTQQSRFIGFQQQPQQPTYPNTTLGGDQKTLLDKVNDGKYYNILSSEQKAINANKKEQEKYRTTSDALMDFQGDVLKNNGKMTEEQMKARYPEFADRVDVLKELQTELRPIVQGGMGVDADQLAQYYPELLQAKKLVNTDEVKKKSEKAESTYQELKKRNDKILKSNWEGLSANGVKFARDANTLFNAVELAKQEGVVGGANDNEILSYIVNNNAQARAIWDEMKSLELTGEDKAMYGMKGANYLENLSATISSLTTKKSDFQPTDDEMESVIRGKEALDADFANSTLKKISTELGVSADSLEKKIYRAYKDWENYGLENATVAFDLALPKSYWEDALGIKLSDKNYMSIMGLFDSVTAPARNERIQQNKQNVMDYTESVNREYEGRKAANLNPDIENYVNSRSMSNMLLQGDLQPFLYKSSGEAAQNVDNLVIMGLGIAAPEIVLPLMAADSYARESQESFEELMEVQKKMGIPQDEAYDNAQKGSVLVGLASSAVELWLEKVLGGVETTASKTFHDILVKDVAERTTKMVAERGLADLLKQGLTTQFRASFEEGMEEIFQQAIHNSSLKQYDPDQKITEGMLESFEGGFYNWMNLLAGGGDVLSNVQQNSNSITQSANQTAYQWGAKAREIVDGLNQGAYNAGVNTRNIVDTVKNKVTNKSTQGTTEVNQTTQQDNNQTTKGKENKPGVFERVTDRGAEKITSTASAQDKLYKAQEPRMNVLSNKKNLERRRSNSDRANELIVQNGYKPTNTAERLEAHQNTLNKLWKQVKDQVNQGEGITVDQTPIIDALSQYIQEKRALNIAGVESELKALEKELNSMKKAQKEGKTDLPILENKKQVFNDIIDWKEQEASEVYKGGIKVITQEIGKIEDAMLSEIPGQFSQLKRDVGALLDSYEDVFKADMKNQRSKGLGLTETYSRIEGVGDIIEGVLGVLSGEGGKVVKGLGKLALGKSLAKAKNVDFLIKTGFEELSNEMKNGGATTAETTNTTPPTTPSTTPPTAPTQTSKNKVTSKKKSDSKNNAAKETTKSVDKKVSNQYNTTTASSNTSSVNLSQNEEATTGTKSSSSGATPQGGELVGPTTAFSEGKKKGGKTPTRGSNFDISNVNQVYSDNFDKIMDGKLEKGEVGKIDGKVAFDGKERPAIFSQEIKQKIEKDHGIDKANMLGTLDKPDYIIKNMNGDPNRINIIRKIPGTNNFVLLAADRSNGFFIVTNYETHNNTNNRMMSEIRRLLKRGELAVDNVGDLTEALKEQPKNKVTGRKSEITNKVQEENKTTPMIKDSEGNTLSKEDQEKFGNSKIVDKDGNLLVVMHGSSNQETHDYYDETKAGSNVHADSKGVYFTDNLDLAEQFAHEQLPGSSAFRTVLGKRGHLYKSYVNITNPLNLNTATPEQLLPFFREDVLTKTWDEEKRLDNLKGHPQFVKFHVDMDKVENAGYDGIIAAIGKEGEGNEYIAFKGNQAKNIGEIEAPKTEAKKEQSTNKVTSKRAEATTPKQEENQTLTKVDGKAQPTQEQRKLIRDWLEKQDLNRDHPFVPMLLNDVSTKGVRDYVYGAISQILGHSGIDFNKATDFFKSIGIDPEGWEREMKSAPEYYYKGKIVNEKKNVVTDKAKVTENKTSTLNTARERAIAERERLDNNGIKPAKSLPKGHKWTEEGSFTVNTPNGPKLTFLPIGDDLYIKNWEQVRTKDIKNTVIENYKRFSANELTNFLNDDLTGGDGDAGGQFVTEAWHKLGLPLGTQVNILKPLNPKERKNVVTEKAAVTEKNTTPKAETKQEAETKPVENSDLREKIGDRFYDYLQKQVDIINESREGNPITINDLKLSDYIDKFEKVAQEDLMKIQKEIEEAAKNRPKAELTEEQKKQLSGITNQAERNKLLKKWQKEWLDNSPEISDAEVEKMEKIMDRAAEIIDQNNKARNYIYDLEIEEENRENEDHYSEESKTKVTDTGKNKVTNPTKSKATSLFNESEVEKGNKSEGLNPDALPLSDYREMQRLKNEQWYPLSDALEEKSIKKYIARKLATELVGNYDEIIADEFDPENIEDERVEKYNDVIDMYEAYEKGDSETADKFANGLIEGKTAKEIVDQYSPDYETDLEIFNRLSKEYPGFTNGKIDLTGDYGKALREFANQDNETAQDIDYQELAEMSNETAQIPTIFEEDLQESNLRDLGENETAQMVEEEEGTDLTTQAINLFKNAEPGTVQYIGDDKKVRARVGFDGSDIVVPGEGDYNAVMFMPRESGDNMNINLYDTSDTGIKNINKVLSELDIPYTVGSEVDAQTNETKYYLENNLTHTKAYFDDNGTSRLKVNKNLKGREIVPRRNTEQQAEYDKQVEQKRQEIEAERQKEQEEKRKIEEEQAKEQAKLNEKRQPLIQYVDEKYSDSPMQRGRVLKDLTEKNDDSKHKIRYYGDDVADDAEVWQVLDALANKNGTFHETWEYGDTYSNTYRYQDPELGRENSIHNITKTQKDYMEYRMNQNPKTTTEITGEKNAVTAKKVEEKPKNVLTDPVENSAFDTLPDDVSVLQESKELGPKRIAPNKVLRQQLSFDEGVDKINDNLKTIAEYMKVREQVYTSEGYNDRELNRKYGELKSQVQNILYGVYWENGLGFNSNKSKEFNDLWKNIKDNENNEKGLKEVAKNFYISKVKKDISKGYVYPQEVLDKIPGAEKAVNARQRYQKGLDTSFSAKDNRIDYSEKDKIGAGIKSQDGKQVTKEQKEDIVKGILDFGETFGLDMKKFAEDRGLVYVHLHGGSPFLTKYGGLYREATNAEGEKNISVSVGGAENVRYKDKKTGKWETKTLNTTMSHELGHAMDYLTDNRLLGWSEKSILGAKYNPVKEMRQYYARGNEIVARAIEQYVAVENGQADYYEENGNLDAGELKGTDMEYYLKQVGSYYDRPGYWSKVDYEKYVKPYVEEAFKNNFDEYKVSKKNVLSNDKNKVTSRK